MTATLVNDTSIFTATPDLDPTLVTLLKPESFEADQYRMLRYSIERACPARPCRVIAVTSAVPGDGKTATAINLAGAIAKGGQSRVLLIDADLRRPAVAQILGRVDTPKSLGLADALVDRRLTLQQVTWRVDAHNLSVVSSRRPQADVYELLSSGRFGELVAATREHFDYIIIDTQPVLPSPETRLLGEFIDGYVIVIAADKTPRPLVAEALAMLGPAKVLGLVFNRESFTYSQSGRYYRYPARR